MAVQFITQQVPPEIQKAVSKTVDAVSMLRPCFRAFALVLSTKSFQVFDAGAGGHKLVTDDVVDSIPESSDAA